MIGSRVYLRVERADEATCRAAADTPVSDLHEALGRPRCFEQTMSETMRPVVEGLRIAGPAVTASCAAGDNLMMHRALSLARRGDVLVVQAPDRGAQWGDIAAYYAMKLGLAGIVVDGFVRDVDALRTMRSPVWMTKIGPSSPQKTGHGSVNAPVRCAGVRVEPGDLIVADGDGVIVVPRSDAPAIVAKARERTAREAGERARIDARDDPWRLHGGAANYEKMDVEEIDAPWRP